MKGFLLGVLVTVIVIGAGFWYRNAAEHASQPIACPVDAEVCPDGTSVSRTGLSCTFPVCPPPNVSLTDVGISFAIPTGFSVAEVPDDSSVAAYQMTEASSASSSPQTTADIIIRQYAITASSTPTLSVGAPTTGVGAALATIQQTAIGAASGAPVSATSFSSTTLGTHRFTVVSIQRFEGVVDTAYYLARETDVLRFDAIDNGVTNWTDSNLDTSTLPAHAALQKLLTTLQGQ